MKRNLIVIRSAIIKIAVGSVFNKKEFLIVPAKQLEGVLPEIKRMRFFAMDDENGAADFRCIIEQPRIHERGPSGHVPAAVAI